KFAFFAAAAEQGRLAVLVVSDLRAVRRHLAEVDERVGNAASGVFADVDDRLAEAVRRGVSAGGEESGGQREDHEDGSFHVRFLSYLRQQPVSVRSADRKAESSSP